MRRSVYLSEENDAALRLRFAEPDGSMNYTKAINKALADWREGVSNGISIESRETEVSRTGELAAQQAPGEAADDAPAG